MSAVRYGLYLRPSPAMCRAQVEAHALLERQYGLRAAGRFMPHATIKGFFKTDAAPEDLVHRLDPVMSGRPAIEVHNGGVVAFGTEAIVLTIQRCAEGSSHNEALQRLHEASLDALLPVVAGDCEFTPREWVRLLWEAHLTLAMADIPPALFPEVLAFVRDLEPIGPPAFTADTVQLFAFRSEDWRGRWWESLTWAWLHSWRLDAPSR